jgi:hypothetical protein
VVENSPLFHPHFLRLAHLAIQFRLPTIGHTPQFAQLGGLLAYGAAAAQFRAEFASLMDKTLKGMNPPMSPSCSRRSSTLSSTSRRPRPSA